MTRSKFFPAFLFLLLLIPAAVFAGSFKDALKGDILPAISAVLTVAFGGGLIAKIGTVRKVRKAIKETSEAIQKVQSSVRDPETKREVREAIEAIAEVLIDVGLKVEADKLRRTVR